MLIYLHEKWGKNQSGCIHAFLLVVGLLTYTCSLHETSAFLLSCAAYTACMLLRAALL